MRKRPLFDLASLCSDLVDCKNCKGSGQVYHSMGLVQTNTYTLTSTSYGGLTNHVWRSLVLLRCPACLGARKVKQRPR